VKPETSADLEELAALFRKYWLLLNQSPALQ
jgi:hypothetical protein